MTKPKYALSKPGGLVIAIALALVVSSCAAADPNSKPTYGDSGLPKNCRAIVQANIDGFRAGQYTAEETMNSLERNCGANGYSWGR